MPISTPGHETPSDATVRALSREFLALRRRELAALGRKTGPSGARVAVSLLLIILCTAAWIVPQFLAPPTAPSPPERLEAGARLTLLVTAERIRDFARAKGRLPNTIAETGIDGNIAYWRNTATVFELWTSVAGHRIEYRSDMNSAAFLGTSLETLRATQ